MVEPGTPHRDRWEGEGGRREIEGSVKWVVIYLRSVHVLATKHLLYSW